MITSKQIREEWQKIMPNLNGKDGFILLTDTEFEEVNNEELLEVLKDHHSHFNEVSPEEFTMGNLFGGAPPKRDCDNWAKSCDAFVDEYYRKKNDSNLQRAFGKCIGLKFNGIKINHTKCWCYSDGIYLVEPQIPEIKSPTKGDELWFVTTL